MNEFKGTKGKWWVKISDGCIEVFSKVKKGNKKVCSLFSKWYGAKETQKANALLISKAPEMLEMLSNISLETEPLCNDSGLGYIIDYDEMDKLRKLIKSATEL